MKRLIIAGSPRSDGRSGHLAEMLFEACIDECPDDEVSLAPVSELDVAPCTGCDFCKQSEGHACALDDDMGELRELLDEADELVVVSPVYFSGAPAPLKALLDRCQPYFWTWERGGARRPLTLHVIGEGGNPNGYEALIAEVRSAGAVAGFRLERIVDWVGKISEQGEITAEGEEYVPAEQKVQFARIAAEDIENVHVIHEENLRQARKAKKKQNAQRKQEDAKKAEAADAGERATDKASGAEGGVPAAANRPKLNIHGANAKAGGTAGKGGKGNKQGGGKGSKGGNRG